MQGLDPEVATHSILEFGRDGLVLAEVGSVPDRLASLGNLYETPFVVDANELHRNQGRVGTKEAHLDAQVYYLVKLIYQHVVYFAYPLVVRVVDGVLLVGALQLCKRIRTSYSIHPYS